MRTEPGLSRFPRVQMGRRIAAFGIDLVIIWLISSLLVAFPAGGAVFGLVFWMAWLLMRVAFVAINRGQSPGRWLLDMKVVDVKFGRVPGLLELCQREGVAGLGAVLLVLGVGLLAGPGPQRNGFGLILFLPLVLDCAQALLDSEGRRAFHDRWSGTIAIATHRGYSLDLKVKQLLAKASRSMRR